MRSKKKLKTNENKAAHLTKGNVFDDLGFSSTEAYNLKLRAKVLEAILTTIKSKKYTQRDLQKLLDQPQPRISELLNGKISKMSLEKLLDYHRGLGGKVELVLESRKAA